MVTGRINKEAGLTGSSTMKMSGHLFGQQKSGRNNFWSYNSGARRTVATWTKFLICDNFLTSFSQLSVGFRENWLIKIQLENCGRQSCQAQCWLFN